MNNVNDAYYHLLLNHFPIVGTVMGSQLLIIGLIFKGSSFKSSSLIIFIFCALISIPVLITGEGAEAIVEERLSVDHLIIETHEAYAKILFWFIQGLGITSVVTGILELRKSRVRVIAYLFTLMLSLIVLTASWYVGESGGKIRHSEIWME